MLHELASTPPRKTTFGSPAASALPAVSMSASSTFRGPRVTSAWQSNVFGFLLALRVANALLLATFFQPDEYFQSLEPAWQTAFGSESGAWITWEWRHQLRSSIHPLLFAALYRAASLIANIAGLSLSARAQLLIAAPKIVQAVFAACIDYFTFQCAQKAYGAGSRTAWTTLILSIASPWQFFCSVRTFSNSLETALTAAALNFWPWSLTPWSEQKVPGSSEKAGVGVTIRNLSISELRLSLLLAAIATILRPTNVLIWIPLAVHLLYNNQNQVGTLLIKQAVFCGASVIIVSGLIDRWYYKSWTFPPLRFLHFNVSQGLAVFYGRNRWDYYLTEGLPLLLTTSLPFALLGLYQGVLTTQSYTKASPFLVKLPIRKALTWTSISVIVCLSLVSHKETRFLYPILPALHIITAQPLSQFAQSPSAVKKLVIFLLLSINIVITIYTTQVHQKGVIDVVHYLRSRHEERMELHGETVISTVGFLMPCHSTPFRSHLVHSGITAWALACEPPVDIPLQKRAGYLDEADQFYEDPEKWLRERDASFVAVKEWDIFWPQYLVFFDQLEPTLKKVPEAKEYRECWRGFNSHWHDDWRRKGDVVVWCHAQNLSG